jgi:hypothetical protein
MVSHLIVGTGFLCAGVASLLFIQGILSPFYWMTLVGPWIVYGIYTFQLRIV